MKLAVLLLTCGLFSTFALGCSGTASEGDGDVSEATTGDAEGALKAGVHYAPNSAELVWHPGCGIALSCAHPSLEVQFVKKDAALKVAAKLSIDNTHHTLKVKLDTYAANATHQKMTPAEDSKDFGHPARLQMGTDYDATVLDWQGNVVWADTIRTSLAM